MIATPDPVDSTMYCFFAALPFTFRTVMPALAATSTNPAGGGCFVVAGYGAAAEEDAAVEEDAAFGVCAKPTPVTITSAAKNAHPVGPTKRITSPPASLLQVPQLKRSLQPQLSP